MGPQQVLRVAGAALIACVGVAQAAPVVAVVDARGGDPAAATELAAALTAAELEVLTGARAEALRGRDEDDRAADAALAEAQDGFGQLDCGRARPSAERAVTLLAGRHAAGHDERARASRAWTYVLLCADRDGDRPVAHHAADRLRGLGGNAAVGADVWARYPDIDAALDRDIVALTITGPAGAAATLDDRAVGAVPVTVLTPAGKHVVAVAGPSGTGAAWITVQGRPLAVDVPARVPDDADGAAWTTRVRGWGQGASAADVDELARAHAVELVAVIEADGAVAVWRRDRDGAARIARGTTPEAVAAARAAYAAAHERAPDPTVPLVREAPTTTEPTRWWVYAAIGGALAVGAVAIYAADAGDDRQRFVLRF